MANPLRTRLRLAAILVLSSALMLPALGASGAPARTQAGGIGTAAIPDTDFEVVTLAKGADKTGEPIAMAVLPDRRVLHTSRDGRVWLTLPDATTSLAGTIPVYSHDEDGLQGIAIDANFETNRWVYVYYAPPLSTPPGDAPHTGTGPETFKPYQGHNQLSRIKLTEAGTIDLSTEQKILQVPADRGICCHAGGEIDFDAAGNLLLSTGDDTDPFNQDGFTPIDERLTRNPAFDAQRTSANTNDLRGKLLRIAVQDDGSYTVPAGNLFVDSDPRTRPEIYAMGFRNPFRFAVDDATGWVLLGDYGPDASSADPNRGPAGQVEFNLIKGPGNYGWPYCHGKSDAYNDYDFATGVSGAKFNCASPTNDSPRNTGLTELPPAIAANVAYDNCSIAEFGCGSESPMGGPTYRYDADNPSQTKFPQALDGKRFAYEFGRGWIKALTFNDAGAMTGVDPIMDSFDFKQLIALEFGPDGSLYVLDYGTGFFAGDANSAVYRIDYVQGTRSPIARASADPTSGGAPLTVQFSAAESFDPDGDPITYSWDFDNDGTADSTEANPSFTYTRAGRYTAALTVSDGTGKTGSASVNLVAGNTAPKVTISFPQNGAVFDYGATIPYAIKVTDPEDGTIDCSRVRLDTALGHNDHAHGHQSLTGCSGTVTIPSAWEGQDQHSYYVFNASYTDVTAPDLELTGTAQAVLEHRTQQAEFFDGQSGLQVVDHAGAAGGKRVGYVDAGDWLRFDNINISGIDKVNARISAYANSGLELRRGSPTGQLLATLPVPSTGGSDVYQSLAAVDITDPGETFALYVVFTGPGMDLDEFTFVGDGAAGNASPALTATVEPTRGTAPLTVDFSATATDFEGTDVALQWDFGVAGAPKPTTARTSYTYGKPGDYTARLNATDGDGRTSVRTFDISVTPDCSAGTPAASDEFDGEDLNYCRWTTLLREDATHYDVADGALGIDALDGDMFGGATNAKNILLQDAPDGAWEAVTKVTLPQGEEYEQAAIMVHSNDANFAKLALIDIPELGWRVEFGQNVNREPVLDTSLDRSGALPDGINDTGIWLKVRSNGTSLTGSWSADGETWTELGRRRSLGSMPQPKVGLAAFNGNGQRAGFDFFRLAESGELACQMPAQPQEGYRMLFDGTAASLSQWRMAGPGGFHLQDDCSILTVGGLGLLYHPQELDSYSLKLDWKMAGDDNAGVFVGFQNPGNDPFAAVASGHEVQIDATDDPDSTTGAIYNYQAAEIAVRDEVLNPPGEWNSYEIVVTGDRIQVILNGTKINDFTDVESARMNAPSLIGLQNHGTGDDVFFRNVQVKEIDTPTGPPVQLELSGPASGTVTAEKTIAVAGTTSGNRVEVRVGAARTEARPTNGRFSAQVPLQMGANKIIVNAFDDTTGLSAARQTTVTSRAFGAPVGGFTDPTGDDNGPGDYRYPANSAFAPGGFDLTAVNVYRDADQARFVTTIAGDIVNPWSGDKISHQRVNIYLGDGATKTVPALPGTNMDIAAPWRAVVVIDGRFDTAGVFAPDGTRIATGTLFTIPATREIGISVPLSAFGDLDLSAARYGTAMFGNAEAGEGVGHVRPVYDGEYWQNSAGGDMWWIHEYRFGGGAGEWEDTPDHDTDVRDPNAVDVIVGTGQTQARVLDWPAASPARLPMLTLDGDPGEPDTTAPTTTASTDPAAPDGDNGWFVTSPVAVTLAASDDSGVPSTAYQLDAATAWSPYTEPVAVSGDGSHEVRFRSTDRAGNVEATRSVQLKIDTAAPVTAATFAPPTDAGWHAGAVPVALASTDAGSGVAEVKWSLDGGPWTPYAEPVDVTGDGEHELLYRATDAAGNEETLKSAVLKIDAVKPTVIISGLADGQLYGDSEDVRVTFQAVDADSGIASTVGTLDGAAYDSNTLQAMFKLSLGLHELTVTATDKAGNVTTSSVRFFVTTSFRDMHSLLDRFHGTGWLSTKAYGKLGGKLTAARQAEAAGKEGRAITHLKAFRALASDPTLVTNAEVRAVLVGDADAMIVRLGGTASGAGLKANGGDSLAGTGRLPGDTSRVRNGRLQ